MSTEHTFKYYPSRWPMKTYSWASDQLTTHTRERLNRYAAVLGLSNTEAIRSLMSTNDVDHDRQLSIVIGEDHEQHLAFREHLKTMKLK